MEKQKERKKKKKQKQQLTSYNVTNGAVRREMEILLQETIDEEEGDETLCSLTVQLLFRWPFHPQLGRTLAQEGVHQLRTFGVKEAWVLCITEISCHEMYIF